MNMGLWRRKKVHPAIADQAPDGLCARDGCDGWYVGRVVDCPRLCGMGEVVSVPADLAMSVGGDWMGCPLVRGMVEEEI